MKNHTIYGVVIAILAFALFWMWRSNSLNKVQLSSVSSALEEKQATITRIQLDNGRLKQEVRSAEIDSRNIDVIADNYKRELDDLKENHKVKIKNLHAYYAASTVTEGKGETSLKELFGLDDDTTSFNINSFIDAKEDSVAFGIFEKHFSISGVVYQNDVWYNYSIIDSISIAWHWKNKGIWPFKRRDKLMVSYSSANPNTILTSASSFAITEDKKVRLTIGPYVGLGQNGISGGISLQYPLIRLRW